MKPGIWRRRDAKNRWRYEIVYRASDGILVNYEIIRQGYAQPLTIPPNDSYANLFVDAAGEAQRAAVGLWSSCRG